MSLQTKSNVLTYGGIFAAGATGLSLMVEYKNPSAELGIFERELAKIDKFTLPGRLDPGLMEEALNKGLFSIKTDIAKKNYESAEKTTRQMCTLFNLLTDGL
jgi:hypothetical protein